MTANNDELRVGIWQDGGTLGNVQANINSIEDACRKASQAGVQLLVFPECYLTGYYNRENLHAVAAMGGDEAMASLKRIAEQSGVAILTGFSQLLRDKVYNSAVFIDDNGTVLAQYHKRALYGGWEQAVFEPGTEPALVNYRGFRIGVLICCDVEFPEAARELSRMGADLIAVPTALMDPFQSMAQHMIRTRAMENHVYIAYANRVGSEHDLRFVGSSSICDPMGKRLISAPETETGLFSATISKAAIETTRSDYDYLAKTTIFNASG